MCWGKLKLNSAGHRPSRTEFDDPWFRTTPSVHKWPEEFIHSLPKHSLCSLLKIPVHELTSTICLQRNCTFASSGVLKLMIFPNSLAWNTDLTRSCENQNKINYIFITIKEILVQEVFHLDQTCRPWYYWLMFLMLSPCPHSLDYKIKVLSEVKKLLIM